MYLTAEEFKELGFDRVDDFTRLLRRAELLINQYINYFYATTDFETDIQQRKEMIQLATAFQIDYMHKSGIVTAEDKQALSSIQIGRTRLDLAHSSTHNNQSNLSIDTLVYLNKAGFGYAGVSYDR